MNYYIREQFTPVNLMNVYKEINADLALLGALFNGQRENLNSKQTSFLKMHFEGYDINEQIHDAYSALGGVLNAMEHI
jgi:hypothetical protein